MTLENWMQSIQGDGVVSNITACNTREITTFDGHHNNNQYPSNEEDCL